MKEESDEDKGQEHKRQPELSIDCLPPQHWAQPAGCQTGEFQPVMWEQRDMMTSLHKTLQPLPKLTFIHHHVQPSQTLTGSEHSDI